MTHEEIKPVLKDAGFVPAMEYCREGSYYSYHKGDKVVFGKDGRASVWEKCGNVLLSGSDDLGKVKQVINEK